MTGKDSPPAAIPLPETIGPYQILGVLGEGGMGVVYEAAESGFVRRRVALKVVRAGLNSRDVIARFQGERQALALMNHSGIAKVFAAGETATGDPYFAMELVRGLPLTEYCDSRRLSTRRRLELFVAVCHAVHHAHQKGVIHRDLKPSNILVTEQQGVPEPKVIDFGIAKAIGQQLTDSAPITHAGIVLGTAAYMSPEQAESSGLDVDTRTDIYSLGVILFELLTGRVPMEPEGMGMNLFLARLASRETDPSRPSDVLTTLGVSQESVARARHTDPESLRRALRGDLDWIVIKSLDNDRARRYDTAAAFAADVTRHLEDEPVQARPPSLGYRLTKLVRRHRVAVPTTVLALLVILASTAFATAGMIRATHAERLAIQEADAARSVTDFLVNLFRASIPGEVPADKVTARQLLDRGATRATSGLARQPALQGRILHAVGSAYGALGLYDAARPQFERALALRQQALGANSLAAAETETALGEVATAHGDLEDAGLHLRRALATRLDSLPPTHVDIAHTLGSLGALEWKQGRLPQAATFYARALRIDETRDGDSAQLARDRMGMGIVRWQQKRFADADTLMRSALAVQERLWGPDSPDLASSFNNLGALYWSMGRYNDALPLYERTRKVFERTLEPGHPRMASILNNLAETYWKLHRYSEAEPMFRRALAIKEARLAPDDVSIAVTLNGLGGLLRDSGRPAEAETVLRRALAIRERKLAPNHPDVTETAQALAALLRAQGRTAEAETLAQRLSLPK